MSRPVPLRVVLSVYHSRMWVDFSDFRAFLNYMTGVEVPLWQVPEARALVVASLEQQFGWLLQEDMAPDLEAKAPQGRAAYVRRVEKCVGGDVLDVKKLRAGAFKYRQLKDCV